MPAYVKQHGEAVSSVLTEMYKSGVLSSSNAGYDSHGLRLQCMPTHPPSQDYIIILRWVVVALACFRMGAPDAVRIECR